MSSLHGLQVFLHIEHKILRQSILTKVSIAPRPRNYVKYNEPSSFLSYFVKPLDFGAHDFMPHDATYIPLEISCALCVHGRFQVPLAAKCNRKSTKRTIPRSVPCLDGFYPAPSPPCHQVRRPRDERGGLNEKLLRPPAAATVRTMLRAIVITLA